MIPKEMQLPVFVLSILKSKTSLCVEDRLSGLQV